MKADMVNLILDILMIMGLFFAGYILASSPSSYSPEFLLSAFLFICGVLLSQAQAIPIEKGAETEE